MGIIRVIDIAKKRFLSQKNEFEATSNADYGSPHHGSTRTRASAILVVAGIATTALFVAVGILVKRHHRNLTFIMNLESESASETQMSHGRMDNYSQRMRQRMADELEWDFSSQISEHQ